MSIGSAMETRRGAPYSARLHVRDKSGAESAAVAAAVDLTGMRVLELGSANGRTTRVAKHAREVHSVDAERACAPGTTAGFAHLLKRRVRFAAHHADALDVQRRRFDLALCGWSL